MEELDVVVAHGIFKPAEVLEHVVKKKTPAEIGVGLRTWQIEILGGAEVVAEATYVQARLQLDVATGRELDVYNIQIDEAKKGRVSKEPGPVIENNR